MVIFAVQIARPLAVNNSEMLRDAAIAGMGIALVPDFSVQAAVRAGELVRVLRGFMPFGVFGERLYAIRPYGPDVPSSVKKFVTVLRERFKGGFDH
jgi:DNA-binding transcriptional LysR family regulator